MIDVPDRITGAWLNNLEVAERIEVLKGPFGQRLHRWAGDHVAFIRWAYTPLLGAVRHRNGSIFFLDIAGQLFAVTAAHVYTGYIEAKRRTRRIHCFIGNLEFDPESRLRGGGGAGGVDIVTFAFTYEELKQIGKQALIVDAASWPPPHPFSGQGAYLAGFPGASRLWLNSRSMSYGLYVGSTAINVASDRQITCPFSREYWIDVAGLGLPPQGYDLGGISGGPLLMAMDDDGAWSFHLAGVISEAQTSINYETVVSTPAHFIAPDGSIYDERSAPVRHAVRATGYTSESGI